FQAEDGIRDFHVTGVQTCALPICCKGASISTFQPPLGAMFSLFCPILAQCRNSLEMSYLLGWYACILFHFAQNLLRLTSRHFNYTDFTYAWTNRQACTGLFAVCVE